MAHSPFPRSAQPANSIESISIFTGVAGFELGMEHYGHCPVLFCEKEPAAQAVLRAWKPLVPLYQDVQLLDELPRRGRILLAGFPCVDLSLAGKGRGIFGPASGLVRDVFRLLARTDIPTVVLENVPPLLSRERGIGMRYITSELCKLGYAYAYRLVDSWYFGVPQRRRRVIIVAMRDGDPREVLLTDNAPEEPSLRADRVDATAHAIGFYSSEGKSGLGLAVDGIPPLKASFTPPAILLPNGMLGTLSLADAERAQALPVDWTKPGEICGARGRHRLVGNAVTRTVPEWIAARMEYPQPYTRAAEDRAFSPTIAHWPSAAWDIGTGPMAAEVSENPCALLRPAIEGWLSTPLTPLSVRATTGFLRRAEQGSLRFPSGFLARIAAHRDRMRELAA
jgi:DNA (cytosine-5)-methyltransferase 1